MPTPFLETKNKGINMSKILKYTFKTPNLVIENGDLVEKGVMEETYTFTLLHKGIGLYEEATGRAVFNELLKINALGESLNEAKDLLNEFVPNLAAASYIKIDASTGKFHNNFTTFNEFKGKPIYSRCAEDYTFVTELIRMASECIANEIKSKENNQSKKA